MEYLEPSRNLITFSKFSDIDYTILNSSLNYLLSQLSRRINELTSGILDCITWQIRSNSLNWSCIVNTCHDRIRNSDNDSDNNLAKLKSVMLDIIGEGFISLRCCYLEIGGDILIEGKYSSELGLVYNPKSFRQPDDTISKAIIRYFTEEYSRIARTSRTPRGLVKLFLIGGECTMLGKIAKQSGMVCDIVFGLVFYTDYESIYDDCRVNHPECDCSLIDYKTCNIEFVSVSGDSENGHSENGIIVANTGKQGLGDNLARNIRDSNCLIVYIISCNEKSFKRDWKILSSRYDHIQTFEIKTINTVCVYKLFC